MRSDRTDAEARQKAAEHRAASLHYLGWEQGAGAMIWARVVTDALECFDAARTRFADNVPDRVDWERLHGAALVILVAVDQILAFERRVRRLTGDAVLAQAREAFDKGHPTAKGLRNVAEHLDDYVVNEGDRQTGKAEPAMTERYPQTFISFAGGAYLDIGGDQLELFSTARAAVRLADMVERVRERYLTRAEREANAALRERYGLDQEA